MEEHKQLTRNYMFSLLAQACQLLGPMITLPYVSRILGVENIGLYSTSTAMAAYFVLAANFGSSVYGQKRIAAGGIKERSDTFWSVFAFRAVPFFLSLTAWIVFALHQQSNQSLLLVQSISVVSVFFDITWLFQGMQDFRSTALRTVVFRILSVALIFLFVKTGQDTILYVLIELLCTALGNISLWLRLPGIIHRPEKSRLHPLECLKECFQFFIPGLAVQAYTALDKVLLNQIFGDLAENGYYEQAVKIVRFITSVLTVYSMVWFPKMAAAFQGKRDAADEESKKRIRQDIQRGAQFVTFLGLPLVLGLELTAPSLIRVYLGEGYGRCADLVRIMAPNIFMVGLSTALGQQFFNPSGRQNISTCFVFIGAFINLVVNMLLIPGFASAGTAISSAVTEAAITLLFVLYAAGKGYFSVRDFVVGGWKHILSSVIMGGFVYILPEASLLQLAISVGSGIAVYLVSLFLLKDEQILTAFRSVK